jgi:hypothetical protein
MRIACVIVAHFFLLSFVSAAVDRLDSIPKLLAATVRITNKDSSGTGFLMSEPSTHPGGTGTVWLVTAAHTWEGMAGEECTLVMRETNGLRLVRREVLLKIRAENKRLWTRHPEMDVAVLRWTMPEGLACQPVPLAGLASAGDFESRKIQLGAGAWIFSYPVQLEANSTGVPILRRGYVSTLPAGDAGSDRLFLVDFTTFGGDSGAPVIVETDGASGKAWLLAGLVQGMHRQTDKATLPFQESTLHYPMGLGIIIPSFYIRQAIDTARKNQP